MKVARQNGWALALALAAGGVAHATVVVPMDTDALVARAPIVAYGKVVQMEVDAGSGFRTAVFEPTDIVRAPEEFKDAREFTCRVRDRAIPHSDLIEKVSSSPQLKLDEELVLFLRPIPVKLEGRRARDDHRRIISLVGFHQGKLRVFNDKQGVRRVLAWNELPEPAVSENELRGQKTTPRGSAKNKSTAPTLDRPAARSLDDVLNASRATAPATGINSEGDEQ